MYKEYSGKCGFIVLTHFCNLKSNVEGKEENAATMLSRLIGQLLSHPSMDLLYEPTLIDRNLVKKLKRKDVEAMCVIFKRLLGALRSTNLVVFCMIDSISSYEGGTRAKTTQLVLSMLSEVVKSQRGRRRKAGDRLVLKLMVTDWLRSLGAWKYFRREEMVEMGEANCNDPALQFGSSYDGD